MDYNSLQVTCLHNDFDKLQNKYGSLHLHSIYGAGCISNPDICFVFMNPTGRNIASNKEWKGIRAQWLGTKNIWKLFYKIGYLGESIYKQIQNQKSIDWNDEFSLELYKYIKGEGIYITNLGKCTQEDARSLPNYVFQKYMDLLKKEIDFIKPKVIVTFGNQVSSILLENNISVSKCRRESFDCNIYGNNYPIYYPVGQGMRNIDLAATDLKAIIEQIKGDQN